MNGYDLVAVVLKGARKGAEVKMNASPLSYREAEIIRSKLAVRPERRFEIREVRP